MNVKFPTAFEEQPIAPESLNNHQRQCRTGGAGEGGSGAYYPQQLRTIQDEWFFLLSPHPL